MSHRPVMAATGPVQAHFQAASRTQFKTMTKILRCTRKIVQKRRGGRDGIFFAADLLQRLRDTANLGDLDDKFLNDLSLRCSRFSKETERVTQGAARLAEYLASSELNDWDPEVVAILRAFYSPIKRCRRIGPEGQVAVGVGASLGLMVGRCEATDGRRTALLRTRIGVAIGFGAQGRLHEEKSAKGTELDLLSDYSQGTGITEWRSDREERLTDRARYSTQHGYGAAWTRGVRLGVEIKALPTTTHWQGLMDSLFARTALIR